MNEAREAIEVIPTWNENDKSAEPFSVVITSMNRREMRASKSKIRFTKVKGFRDDYTSNATEIEDQIFLQNTLEIKGLKHPITHKSIRTAEDLYDARGMGDLITEIVDYIQDISNLKPEQVKNSEPPSAGT